MGVMNWWVGKISRTQAAVNGSNLPTQHNINPALALTSSHLPTPQSPGDYSSISIPQLPSPDFCSDEDREIAAQIRIQASQGKKNAILVMNDLLRADEFAAEVEEHYYGPYREGLVTNYKRRVGAKTGDMKRLHKTRVFQQNAVSSVEKARDNANRAISEVRSQRQIIAASWNN